MCFVNVRAYDILVHRSEKRNCQNNSYREQGMIVQNVRLRNLPERYQLAKLVFRGIRIWLTEIQQSDWLVAVV